MPPKKFQRPFDQKFWPACLAALAWANENLTAINTLVVWSGISYGTTLVNATLLPFLSPQIACTCWAGRLGRSQTPSGGRFSRKFSSTHPFRKVHSAPTPQITPFAQFCTENTLSIDFCTALCYPGTPKSGYNATFGTCETAVTPCSTWTTFVLFCPLLGFDFGEHSGNICEDIPPLESALEPLLQLVARSTCALPPFVVCACV